MRIKIYISIYIFFFAHWRTKNTQQHLTVIKEKRRLHYVPLPVQIYIFNAISDGDDKSKAATGTLVALCTPVCADGSHHLCPTGWRRGGVCVWGGGVFVPHILAEGVANLAALSTSP